MDDSQLITTAQAATALDHAHQQVVAAEIGVALAIAARCDTHRVDETSAVEGAEQWVHVGAPGTPMVGEFIAGEIAGILGVSTGTAFLRMAEVLNIRHRHPSLWAEFLAGRMRLWEAGKVAGLAPNAGLDEAACARFDRLCATALRMQPWSRVRRNVAKWLIQVDPVRARERREAKARERYARVGRIEDGHVQWWGQLNAADGIALDQALTQVAAALDGDTVDAQRAAALGVMARHALGQCSLPAAELAPGRGRRAEMTANGTILTNRPRPPGWGPPDRHRKPGWSKHYLVRSHGATAEVFEFQPPEVT